MSWWYFTQPANQNRLTSGAGLVTLMAGFSGLVLSGLWSGAFLGEVGLAAMLAASATAVLGVVAALTGWGERSEHSLGIEISREKALTTLGLTGVLDYATRHVLRERIKALVDEGDRQFVVDMDGVEYLDSTGLGSLVAALKRARQGGGELTVRCKAGPVRRVLEMTNLTQEFGVAHHRHRGQTAHEAT